MKLRYLILPLVCLLFVRPARAQTAFATGNLTAIGTACTTSPPTNTSHISISTIGFGGATFTLSGTFVATVGFYASGDGGVTWQPLNVTPSNSSSAVTTATAVGLWQANVSAYTNVCILDLVQTSGTVAARIHISTISARTGSSGGGGASIPSGGLTGQVLAIGPSNTVVASSPGLQDAASSPITGGTYTPTCGTVDTGDRARIFVTTATSQIVIPPSGGANCSHAVFYFLAQAPTTFNFSTGDSFDIYDGNARTTACATGCTATAYNVAAGQYLTVVNGAGTVWHFLVEAPGGTGGGGPSSLSSLTAATAANTINSAGNIQTWNWTTTNPNASLFNIGESAPSSGGNNTGILSTQALLSANTLAGSTATPFSVTQGANTSANGIPVAQFATTWNSAAMVGSGLALSVTNTASAAGSKLFSLYAGAAGTTSVFSVDPVGNISATGGVSTTGVGSFSGISTGSPFHANGTQVNLVVQGGADATFNGYTGGGWFRGADNNSGLAAAAGGYAMLRGGMLYGAYVAGQAEGATLVASGYKLGTIAAAFDAVCGTTTAFTVSDCTTAPQVNVIGIATGTGAAVNVVGYGTVPVHLAAALTNIGDTVCLSTTVAGAMVDSGGQGNCAAGTQIGIIVASSGALQIPTGLGVASTITLSTTQPLVQLHIR